ncbi:MAG: primosomal protein N' [Deltaproteobacteria bacterium]|nr:primosomal protein N' [Deltaproteobacteria bacterium]
MSLPEPIPAPPEAPAYAEVALLRALPGRDALTYAVPAAWRGRLRRGMRVVAPLGTRHETGIVTALHPAPPADVRRIRDIVDVLDAEPIVSGEVFELCRWSARYYLAGLADVLAVALPGGLRARSARVLRIADAAPAPKAALEAAILERVRDSGDGLTLTALERALANPGVARAVRALVRRGTLTSEELRQGPSVTTRYATILALVRELDPAEAATLARRAPRQLACYERLLAAPDRRLDVATLDPGARAAASTLVKRGMATRERVERYRDLGATASPARAPELTAAQRAAIDAVAPDTFRTFLLHGVTGSGKTEVYLRLAARTRAAGRSVLMLVPEIALTHQLVARAQERFGDTVALVHSGLAPGQRWDEWRRIARGEARVVVGTRSAIFAPLVDLGLVIVDEEHDAAYKQDEGLRYHGRDLAIVRAKLANVPVVLGSATPSVESHQQALDGKYRRLTLPERVHGRPLPQVTIVDLRSPDGRPVALRVPNDATTATSTDPCEPATPLFSPILLTAMEETLGRGEQTLLFLNRRGFASAMHCLVCGEPAGCPSCSVSLTLHRRRVALLCHHCGYARSAREIACTACRRGTLVAMGLGTERIEAEVAARFPGARVGRLDRDTTARRGAHRRILEAWSGGKLDVLIGTQMVAKGHDVPGVTLVGVLLADVALSMPDFRAGERAFQLLTQVAGRAGRGPLPGRVVVQTYRPTHHSLAAAAAHDYESFAPAELASRRETDYPPFARLAVLRFEGPDFDRTGACAERLAARVRAGATAKGVLLRGPAPAPLERLRDRYRWQLVLTASGARALHETLGALQTAWRASSDSRTVRLVVDVDPVSML